MAKELETQPMTGQLEAIVPGGEPSLLSQMVGGCSSVSGLPLQMDMS